ncbi:glycosyltransferase family 2 protein [Lewinella sp. IMCC34191]|uniref:glycosyltransferase family 2 protein n=1 Tax=Lewinella sp. IMCC34191 TaxID=2259172 RepID=UPI000E267C03|nr:glycosyltransferase [Lewinella sp. IMCC34191]
MEVSIVIPAYNAGACIERSVSSAIAAGSRVPGRWEVIVVNNRSTDNTWELLQQIAANHPNLIRLANCPQPGASFARNLGTKLSSGKWIQYLDADDEIHPLKIVHQLNLADDAQWVVGAYQNRYLNGRKEDVLPSSDLWKGLYYGFRTGHTISNLLQRTAVDQIGGWNEDLPSNQDPDLHYRLLKAQVPFVLDPVPYSFYNHDNGKDRITNRFPARQYALRLAMLMDANGYLMDDRPGYWADNEPFFLGATLSVIRQLATFDILSAEKAYNETFSASENIRKLPALDIVPQYTRLYPYLGFRNVERLRLALAGVIPAELKRILKS